MRQSPPDALPCQAVKARRRRRQSILDGKAATARLDGAKAELAEKRRVIEAVYKNALEALVALDKKYNKTQNCVEFYHCGVNNEFTAERILFADRVDTVYSRLALQDTGYKTRNAANYNSPAEILKLDVVKEKKLKASNDKASVEGGFVLTCSPKQRGKHPLRSYRRAWIFYRPKD